jgi:acyl carrier protein
MPAETHSHRGALSPDDVRAVVVEQLSEVLGRDPDDLTPDARLRDDLDADDFALIDVFDAVERELGERMVGFRIEDDELAEIVTVQDAIDCVLARLRRGDR